MQVEHNTVGDVTVKQHKNIKCCTADGEFMSPATVPRTYAFVQIIDQYYSSILTKF